MEGIDPHTIHDETILIATELIITARRDCKSNRGDEVQHDASHDLPELVLAILVLSQETSGTSLLLLVDEDRGRDTCEDQAVEQRERESFVLAGDHGGEKGVDNGQADDAELAYLQALEAGRCIGREGQRERHSESVDRRFAEMW